ncbi:MAG: cobalamin biosynthesis protein CbiM [Dehalococcoidia bacterium]|nr:cobalamin biosynthesis protein CbiM [Dehalococcoidia bacterium]
MLYIPIPAREIPDVPGLHIPDGFVSLPVSLIGWAITIAVIALAVKKTNTEMGEKAAPLMGVLAAFIFAGQMINFPVAGGTSGHLLGGTLAAILVGPWAAVIVMTAVVGVQALIFQDGGLVVLGTNILNMGILTAFLGYGIFRAVTGVIAGPTGRLAGSFSGAWLTVMAAATLTSVQLALSGTSALDVALPAMLGVHALIGVGEGLITAAAIALVVAARPDLIERSDGSRTMSPEVSA